jgi:hypothetical protein
MSTRNKIKFGIREELLTSFVVLTLIALGSVAIATGGFINLIGSTTSNQTTKVLEDQIKSDMGNKTHSVALDIQAKFQQVTNDVNGLAEATMKVIRNPIEFGDRKSYYHANYLPAGTYLFNGTLLTAPLYQPFNQPADLRYDTRIYRNVSDTYSHYLIYQSTYYAMGNNEYNLSGIQGNLINRTAQLDPIMSEIWHKNPQYAWLYMEFEMGVQRNFPYFETDKVVFRSLSEPTAHDYKNDQWYIDAKAANGNIVWGSPYIDPNLGWIITCSRAIYNGTISPQNFIGVVAIDMKLDTISATVLNVKFLKTGYGFLIDTEGIIISHPHVVFDPEAEEGIALGDVEPISSNTINAMLTGKTGFNEFLNHSKTFYLSYTPIPLTNYSLGIIAPKEEALQSVQMLQNQLNNQLTTQLITIFIILAIVAGVVIVVGLKVADSVVRPIKKLTDLAIQLSTDNVKKAVITQLDTNFDKDLGQEEDEIGDLSRAFKILLVKVKEDAEHENQNNKT